MTLRTATVSACFFDAAGWALVAFVMFDSGSDPATRGLDKATGYIVTALFLITAVPALVCLSYSVGCQELHSPSGSPSRRSFTALFIAAIIAFA